jgi:hypothetical protein
MVMKTYNLLILNGLRCENLLIGAIPRCGGENTSSSLNTGTPLLKVWACNLARFVVLIGNKMAKLFSRWVHSSTIVSCFSESSCRLSLAWPSNAVGSISCAGHCHATCACWHCHCSIKATLYSIQPSDCARRH